MPRPRPRHRLPLEGTRIQNYLPHYVPRIVDILDMGPPPESRDRMPPWSSGIRCRLLMMLSVRAAYSGSTLYKNIHVAIHWPAPVDFCWYARRIRSGDLPTKNYGYTLTARVNPPSDDYLWEYVFGQKKQDGPPAGLLGYATVEQLNSKSSTFNIGGRQIPR